jgi:uncharacterized protein YbjT (DUF2867 family)
MTTVLVTGITGKQGDSAARSLLARGFHVRGTSRDPESAASRAWRDRGVEVVRADFREPESLSAAMKGVDAVFAMSTPFEAGEAAETAQGIALVDAAKATGVGHFVYTSVANADRATGIPHFDSKWEVEQHLAASGLNATVIAPAYFMENLFFPTNLPALREQGVLPMPMPADVPLAQVAVRNIGEVAAAVIAGGEAHYGKRYDLAGDAVSAADAARALGDAIGRPFGVYEVPIEAIRSYSEDMATMYEWFVREGYSVDVAALRETFPEVEWVSYRDWVETVKDQVVG